MTPQMVAHICAFIVYLGFMVFIGLRTMKKNNSASDFFLGGRKMGPWVTALSAEASDMSGWLLMGLPGLAYLGGMKEAFWTAVGLAVGTYLSWLIVAKPLRKCTIAFGDAITLPEFFTNRFKDKSHILATVLVIFNILFFTIYVASGLVACAKLFQSVFGINYHLGLIIGFVVVLAYTVTGGYMAVCSTDFVQGTLMFIALIITGCVMLFVLKGPTEAFSAVSSFGNRAMSGEFGDIMKEKFSANQSFGITSVISAVVWGLGYFGMPHFIIRFMGIRSNKEITTSRRVAIIWVIVALAVAVLVGSLGTVYLPQVLDASKAETVFSETIKLMFPAFVAGIFLCAILAAAMSTADSQLLVASSSFSQDVYKCWIKKNASDDEVLLVSRLAVVAVAVIALVIAIDEKSSVFNLVSNAWAGFGATLGPLVLLSIFWKKITKTGAIAGLVTGGIAVIVWNRLPATICPIFGIYEILPAFILNLVVAIAVSLIVKDNDPEIEAAFDAYKKLED
ncbi:MAG: sodium/proline symporter PutP [Treponema sp.]|uniref:sodium/proline symporter PutP n=1 Tax=Treponema sp. TaxID=166 RepID=UPI00298D7E08|nr:sodium/proline symporter PutP [Treponema sp.]MBR5933423.1 sodium/proline symporter PutP [Treponema sp.]